MENGADIDASGQLNGKAYNDAAGLGRVLRDDPQVAACLVDRAYSYGTGREIQEAERSKVAVLEQAFAAGGYRFKALIRQIATADSFYDPPVSPPQQRAAKKGSQDEG